RLGRLHHISRSGTLRTGPAQNFRLVGIHSGHQHRVLVALRGRQLQGLVLILQRADVVVVQRLQNRTAVGIGVVNDIPGAVRDGVAGIASLGRHVIPNALDGILDTGRLSSEVVIHAVDSSSVVAAALLELGAQVTHSSVHPVEAVGHSVLDGGLAVLEVLERKAVIDVCTGQNALGVGAAPSAKAAEHTAQTTKTTEAAQTAETEATAT